MKPRRRRRSLLVLLGTSAAAAAALPIVASTVSGAPVLPDLVSEPPVNPYTQIYADGRLLMRFDGYITNDASATSPLEIRATNFDGSWRAQSVKQYVGNQGSPGEGGTYQAPPAGSAGPQVQFENADGHNHFHLKYAAEYSLWNQDKSAQVALAQKTQAGFCLEDSMRQDGSPTPDDWIGYSAGSNNFCWVGKFTDDAQTIPAQPGNTLVMGISPGFKDLYSSNLTYQWVDISNVQPGPYQLAARVDPFNIITESNESNNSYKFTPVTITGFAATPVSVPQTGGTQTVTLGATQYGSPSGTRVFMVRSAPRHGTLNVAVGNTFVGPTLQYTPKAGYKGSDSFTYSAMTNGWAYPTNPAEATATLAGNTVAVGISGAPASMVASTSVQLSAQVTNAPGGVVWSTSAGSITPAGLLTAPAGVPAGGKITVTATSAENPDVSGAAVITVTSAKPGGPAPDITNMSAGKKPLSAISVVRSGKNKRTVRAQVATGSKGGKVTITTLFKSKTVLHTCAFPKAKARRLLICKYTVPNRFPMKKVSVRAKITTKAGATFTRRHAAIG